MLVSAKTLLPFLGILLSQTAVDEASLHVGLDAVVVVESYWVTYTINELVFEVPENEDMLFDPFNGLFHQLAGFLNLVRTLDVDVGGGAQLI